ncbi:hypothetical protein BGZ73_002268, partial [Actinomortierella ambigua]
MADLVANPDPEFTEKLLRYKDTGFTRVEVTFYGRDVFKASSYQRRLSWLLDELDDCVTCETSYAATWKS